MNKKSRSQAKKPPRRGSGRAATAARDPDQRASNRPGFDLGGAVGDTKPHGKSGQKRSTAPMTVDPVSRDKANAGRVPGSAQGAAANIGSSLGGKYKRYGIK